MNSFQLAELIGGGLAVFLLVKPGLFLPLEFRGFARIVGFAFLVRGISVIIGLLELELKTKAVCSVWLGLVFLCSVFALAGYMFRAVFGKGVRVEWRGFKR